MAAYCRPFLLILTTMTAIAAVYGSYNPTVNAVDTVNYTDNGQGDNGEHFIDTNNNKNTDSRSNNSDLYYYSHVGDADYSSLHQARSSHLASFDALPRTVLENSGENSSLPSSTTLNRRKHRRDAKLNLCDAECGCIQENSFVTVNCDLYQNREYIFGPKKYIPRSATSLVIKLAPRAHLRIESGLFYENKLNKIVIEGTPNGSEQIEIRTDAMIGNNAPFPYIEVLNCHTLILRSNAFKGEFKFNATNCHDVIIYSYAFHNTSVYGYFNDIQDLRIHEQAFNSAKAKLNIVGSTLENLYRFEASLREIRFFNCSIGNINGGTFDVLKINSIIFEACKIDVIKTRAITEKLLSDHLAITGAIIGIIESEAIAGSGISELILARNEIDTIQENAIYVTAVNATIVHNSVKHTGHDWLHIKDWTNITIAKNRFGDYDGINLAESANPETCTFHENFITKPKPGSLNITNRHCIIREISFFQPCTCDMNWLSKLTSRDLKSESYCTIDDTLKFCFNTSIFNVLKYENEICDYTAQKLDCMKTKDVKRIQGEFLQPEDINEDSNKKMLIYILIGVATLVVIVIIAITITYKCIKHKSSTTATTNFSTNTLNGGGTIPRTFSHDDRAIIHQTLERMKDKYLPEVYEQVHNNTQVLLRGNITETQRVKAIGEIVQTLGECQNTGEDFVAFTDILYKHLAPSAPPEIDPVYAEPTLPRPENVRLSMAMPEGQTNIDHIYAEPMSVQQPLLPNEYASPADRNELTGLYTEPITHGRGKSNIIPPYAVTTAKDNVKPSNLLSDQQPSTSKNLPDVLNPTKPMTNVQKLAQNFANNPNFHITRSPTTNRKIPQYTVPNKEKPLADKNSRNGQSEASSDARSDHSGGSDITVKIDDIIDYADA